RHRKPPPLPACGGPLRFRRVVPYRRVEPGPLPSDRTVRCRRRGRCLCSFVVLLASVTRGGVTLVGDTERLLAGLCECCFAVFFTLRTPVEQTVHPLDTALSADIDEVDLGAIAGFEPYRRPGQDVESFAKCLLAVEFEGTIH